MISFDKIVKKMLTKQGMIISSTDMGDWFFPDSQSGKAASHKLTSRLMACQILIPIKNGLYLVSDGTTSNPELVIDDIYWKILHKLIVSEVSGKYLIVGNKSLELLLRDYSVPERIYIYTKDVEKTIKISSDHTVVFRMVRGGKRVKGENIFGKLHKYHKQIEVDGKSFTAADEDLSMLDALTSHSSAHPISDHLIEKAIKKFSKLLSERKLGELVELKYLTAMNRLRVKAKELGDLSLYRQCVDIINRHGASCFITIK